MGWTSFRVLVTSNLAAPFTILNDMQDQLAAATDSTPIAELHEVQGPKGRTWRIVTSSEGFADHAWQQRQRLLQISDGAAAIEICWKDSDGEPVELAFSPSLPVVLEAAPQPDAA